MKPGCRSAWLPDDSPLRKTLTEILLCPAPDHLPIYDRE